MTDETPERPKPPTPGGAVPPKSPPQGESVPPKSPSQGEAIPPKPFAAPDPPVNPSSRPGAPVNPSSPTSAPVNRPGGVGHPGQGPTPVPNPAAKPGATPYSGGPSAYTPPPKRTSAQIRADIEAQRAELGQSVDHLRDKVTELTDWRSQLRKHRKKIVVGAVATGFVVGGLMALRRR